MLGPGPRRPAAGRNTTRIGYWHDEADRAKASAVRAAEQVAAWAAGCQQGREDVLSLAVALAEANGRNGLTTE